MFSQSVVKLNDTTYYLLNESQARAVVMLDADLTAIERENAILYDRIAMKDSIIEAMTAIRVSTTAIDSAQTEVIDTRGQRIDLSKKEVTRLKRQRTWAAIKGAWREITVGVTAAGVGYGIGYVASR